MGPSDSTGLHPAVLKLFLLAAGLCALIAVSVWAYGAYQQQAAQAARAAAQATAVAIANDAAIA
jgi:hypothetical protein